MYYHRIDPFRRSQAWQSFAVEVATNDVAACFGLMDVPNRDDASDDDDKCFCDYSSYSACERLCDTNCKRHCSAVEGAAAPCDALVSASCSRAFRKRRIGGMQSRAEATTIDSIRSLRYRHCPIHDFRFLFIRFQPTIFICQETIQIFRIKIRTIF